MIRKRSLKDYDTLGKIYSRNLQFENSAYVTYRWKQYKEEYVDKTEEEEEKEYSKKPCYIISGKKDRKK